MSKTPTSAGAPRGRPPGSTNAAKNDTPTTTTNTTRTEQSNTTSTPAKPASPTRTLDGRNASEPEAKKPMAERMDNALVKPDDADKQPEPPKEGSKEQFDAADAAAARSTSGL